jgi:cell division septation protein DedD
MKKLTVILAIILFTFCSAPQQTQKENDVYVFDVDTSTDVKKEEIKIEKPIEIKEEYEYIVQIGAFSSKEKAETYVRENKQYIYWDYKIFYSNPVGLFVIQLNPLNNRVDAEKIRDKCWSEGKLKDALL